MKLLLFIEQTIAKYKHWGLVGIFSLTVNLSIQGQIDVSHLYKADKAILALNKTQPLPDTLLIGEYSIVVEEYTKANRYDLQSNTYNSVSGYGKIFYSCMRKVNPFEIALDEIVLRPYRVKVVDLIRDPLVEISIKDAKSLELSVEKGAFVDLMLPNEARQVSDLSKYLNDFTKLKTVKGGIRVSFNNLTLKRKIGRARQGIVLSGNATYPSSASNSKLPFVLDLTSGFKLEVDTLTISPNPLLTIANGRILLPTSIAANEDCKRASLPTGSIILNPKCEFYKELPLGDYGTFGVGNTTLNISGRGYVLDFSGAKKHILSGKPEIWKGVVLLKGGSKGKPSETVISNIGYLQNEYRYENAFIESKGLYASFNSSLPYKYTTSQPLGYNITLNISSVSIEASSVRGGVLRNGRMELPRKAVRQSNDATVALNSVNLNINSEMGLLGTAVLEENEGLYWGDYVKAGGGEQKSFGLHGLNTKAFVNFVANNTAPFFPLSNDGENFQAFNLTNFVASGLQGVVLQTPSLLVINSPDVKRSVEWDANNPNPSGQQSAIAFLIRNEKGMWLNVVAEGVHCHIESEIYESMPIKLGDWDNPLYAATSPFDIPMGSSYYSKSKPKTIGSILLNCVESAVFKCDFNSYVNIPQPTQSTFGFKEMVFTSTADNAGGKLVIGTGNESLDYWGLGLVQKPGFSSAGLISVKTGQIIMSAAGLTEPRHFVKPFWINWGEMLADGSIGRLFFDYNSADQAFDSFKFVPSAIALSPYNLSEKGFLKVGGMAHFPFFGGDYLNIEDLYDPSKSTDPFNKRLIKLSSLNQFGFLPTDYTIFGNWSDGKGIFDFDISYNEGSQDGFIGVGKSTLSNLLGGELGSTLEMNSRGTCIRIGSNLLDQRSLSLGPVANISTINRIWGCVCIKNDGVENLVVGGEVTNAANVSVAARVGSHLSAVLQVTPSFTKATFDGEAYLSLAASLDAVVNGHIQLTTNHSDGFVEGEVQGKMRAAEGALFVGSSLEAEGQANWHIGLDFHELQGMVGLKIMTTGAGAELGSAFYIGKNAQKSRAWVLLGRNPLYSLNMDAMPDRLTGIYGSMHINQGVNLFLISGGYEIDLGLGAFVLTPNIATSLGGITPTVGLPYVVGNLGGRIHGEILGGIVSAGAYFNLQLLGPYPFGFQGTVGLEGCALWVACTSVDLTVGLNSAKGFYIK